MKLSTTSLSLILAINFIFFKADIYSQTNKDDISPDVEIIPVTPVKVFVKNSIGKAKNNLYHDGKIYGFLNGDSTFIDEFKSQETFAFNTGNYDSLQFYYQWDIDDRRVYKLFKFFIKVEENKPFTFTPIPIQNLVGLDIETENVKKFKGKKLYEIRIQDDVNAREIEIMPLPESASFIEPKFQVYDTATATAIYHINLKDTRSFANEVSKSIQDRILKGEEVIMPIGIKIFDKKIPSHFEDYKLFLKKKKKKKTK